MLRNHGGMLNYICKIMNNISYQNHVGHCFAFFISYLLVLPYNSARGLFTEVGCTIHSVVLTILPHEYWFPRETFFQSPPFLYEHVAWMLNILSCPVTFIPVLIRNAGINVKDIKLFSNKKLNTEYCSKTVVSFSNVLYLKVNWGIPQTGLLWELSHRGREGLHFMMG